MADRGAETSLLDPVRLAGRTAPSRVVFGPHETNLGQGRALSARHVAYYGRRAAGGAGVIITEVASVLDSDWPYERAPLAAACPDGWRQIAAACQRTGTVLLAGLGHAGLQGSSAWSQRELWGPSGFADPVSRETPMVMGRAEIVAVIEGFAAAAALAAAAGADGVEIDAGPGALLRQFHSGLTNQRADAYGADRLALTRAVLAAVRGAIGARRVLALRLSCDELAPWAGVTPQLAAAQAAALAPQLDLLTVVRGGPYSGSAYRPDAHTPPQFNQDLAAGLRAAAGGVPVVLQGSVVDPEAARAALAAGAADLVEMTRAQIADGELVAKLRAGQRERIRPCILCNQKCRVRDSRNPLVTCVGDPRSGYESVDPPEPGHQEQDARPRAAGLRAVLVVGGGPAGLEAARVAAAAGHPVRLAERGARLGGTLRAAAVGASRQRMARLADWLEAECRRLGVTVETGTTVTAADLDAARAGGTEVILATGSHPVPRWDPGTAVDALAALSGQDLPDGPVVVHDPVGGPAGVAVAEWLAAAGRAVAIVSPDPVIGRLLSLTGDLADANVRLQQAGVSREPRSLVRAAGGGTVLLEDVWTGEQRRTGCAVLVDCGHRLPAEELYQLRPGTVRAGDCVAPRSVYEAVLDGRRAAQALGTGRELAPAGFGGAP
ncbi:MAG TPA: mycofactocin system FadH/OYE family oxidoreductase 1 [Streptosporangiaceae bacterium]|jgi:2,4-dienoyl-CoA reductase (NADPH2)